MVTYIVIAPDGQLNLRTGPASYEALRDEVGEPGYAQVTLHGTPGARAFVNDCGHVLTPPLDRNPIGACVVWCLGASAQAYAGPIVITGWVPLIGDTTDLDDAMATAVIAMHGSVWRDLHSDNPSKDLGGYAEWVRTSPAPTARVLTGAEALAHLRSLGRDL